jgi:VWFA-related protein
LLNGLSADDSVAVVRYAEAPLLLLNFTSDKQSAAQAIDQVRFNVGFGSLNLSASLAAVLDALGKEQGKKTIVLLSTGLDTSAPRESEGLLTRLKTTDTRLLCVSLGAGLRSAAPQGRKPPSDKAMIAAKEFAEADHLLITISEASGGRAYFPKNAKEFASVFSEIAQLVRHEYSLAFAPPVRDGKVHTIAVRVFSSRAATSGHSGGPYRVDHRSAYLAPGS